jgi:PTH1 family peptidyl-tRNA hydrolase
MGFLNRFKQKPNAGGAPAFIICGLGNPGLQYENTRHNAGFLALDALADKHGVTIKKLKFKSLTQTVTIGDTVCLLMKPTTYMNKSGEAVAEAARFYKIPPENILVLYDDISLPVGKLRLRRKGSDGGHNGIKSILLHLNTDAFPRIKIGVGQKPHPDFDLAAWVLSPFKKEEGKDLEKALSDAAEAVEFIISGEMDKAMNRFN